MSDVRQATDKILEMVEEGILDKDMVIMSCLKYMSEDDVADMAQMNEFFPMPDEEDEDDEEDEEDDWDGSNYPKDNPLGESV